VIQKTRNREREEGDGGMEEEGGDAGRKKRESGDGVSFTAFSALTARGIKYPQDTEHSNAYTTWKVCCIGRNYSPQRLTPEENCPVSKTHQVPKTLRLKRSVLRGRLRAHRPVFSHFEVRT